MEAQQECGQVTPPGDGNSHKQMESISQGDAKQEVRSCDHEESNSGEVGDGSLPEAKQEDMCNSSGALPSGKNHRALSLQDEQLLKASLRGSSIGNNLESDAKTEPVGADGAVVDDREEIFEPRPSTSNSPSRKDLAGKRSMSLAVDPSDRRQRLLLLPRTTQYEKHPLLQDRSISGITELEAFLMEKEQTVGSKRGHHSCSEASTSGPRQPLVPREAHYATHPLLVKKNSGLTELEQLLQEKERQLSANQDQSSPSDDDELDKNRRRKSLLQPRTDQYQASALLESRDETGLSPIDHLLIAKNEEIEKGKCSVRCTCKNMHCPNCKGSSGASSPRSPSQEVEGDTEMRIEPKTASKRVHFFKEGTNAEPAAVVGEMKKFIENEGGQAVTKSCANTEKLLKFSGGGRKKEKKQQQQQMDQKDTGASLNDNKQKCKASSVAGRKQTCAVS